MAYELYILGAITLIFIIFAAIAFSSKKAIQISNDAKIKEENILDITAFNKIEARKWSLSAVVFLALLLINFLIRKYMYSSKTVFFLLSLLIGTLAVFVISADAFKKQQSFIKHSKKKKRR